MDEEGSGLISAFALMRSSFKDRSLRGRALNRQTCRETTPMAYFVDRVVLCDAYREPDQHYQLLPGGKSKRVTGPPTLDALPRLSQGRAGRHLWCGRRGARAFRRPLGRGRRAERGGQSAPRGHPHLARGRLPWHGRGDAPAPGMVVRARRGTPGHRTAFFLLPAGGGRDADLPLRSPEPPQDARDSAIFYAMPSSSPLARARP